MTEKTGQWNTRHWYEKCLRMEPAEEAAVVGGPRVDLHSEKIREGSGKAGNYFWAWNGQHQHLRQLTDSVDFWVIITHRNAGHVRLWSAERCHVAFKLPPLSCSPAKRVGAKDFCPSTLRTSYAWHFIPYYIARSLWGVQFPHQLSVHQCTVTSVNTLPLSPLYKMFSSTLTGCWIFWEKAQIVHLKGSLSSTSNLYVQTPSYPLLSPASPDFNYLPSGMWGIHWRRRLHSTSPVSCAHFIFLVSHFQD